MSVIIRPVTRYDASRLAEIYSQPDVQQNTLQLPYPSTQLWEERILNYPNIGHIGFVAVIGEVVVGNITLFTEKVIRVRHNVSFGVAVDASYTRRGIAQQLIDFALDYAFNWLAAQRVELRVFSDNLPAISLYQKLGFVVEGTLRQAAFKDGRYQDIIVMSKLVSEYF
ncbi:GNAT family N-acetyltransferase [Rosenbergiella australiborealis]|uniref:GNAT family N-acetyltransferase n=1 Tax=Rosenbergiella australiborealis TaxID=1544696 RepID=A0ABS5T5V1_9GAMM|nr:GNAT family N-acetyltransferase [Rosenbergiella australiborealis]MBT0727706.1 GNAT family N-acetyltransferase [Rosenbergiella australiborealis]